jgi:hypothetical protein
MVDETPIAFFKAGTAALRIYDQEVEVAHAGLIRVTRQRIRYDQIAQVLIKSGMMYSTLIIESTGGHTLQVGNMYPGKAQEARAAIQERMNLTASSAPTSVPGADIPAQIRALAELKEAGILTEAKFEAKKQDLLDRM